MKFWDIALFLFIVNVFGIAFSALASDMGYSSFYLFHKETTETLQTMESKVQTGISDEEITGDDPVTYALGIMYSVIKKAILAVFNPLKEYILWLPFLLINLGVPTSFAHGMGAIFWLIQIVGLVQIITGRSFAQVE